MTGWLLWVQRRSSTQWILTCRLQFTLILYYIITIISDILQNIIQFSENLRRGIVIVRDRFAIHVWILQVAASFSADSLYIFDILYYNRCILQINVDINFNNENIFTIVLLLLYGQIISGIQNDQNKIFQKGGLCSIYLYSLYGSWNKGLIFW